MAVVQNLYQIFKLPVSFLVENNCVIKNYTLYQGIAEQNVVSIGDNLVFQQLRYFHDDYRDHRSLFSYITKLRNNVHIYKKKGQYKEAHILEQRISEVLFVKDIINVVIDNTSKKSDFHKFRTKGFYVNGIHYIYLCSGSGQIRRNTATFINEEYHDRIVKILNCGLDEKTSEFVLAKYSAYFALAFSSILWVRTPRVCVIKDFYNTLPQEHVDYITQDENGKSIIEERIMDLELNCADGQGLIDPSFAQDWATDMNLTYVPCSFVARSCFIKGNLATFDFKGYAHEHGINTIKDKWGEEYNIDEIDILLSESQFKTHKYYSSWQDYCDYAEKGNIHWGVARYTKREDAEYTLSNYQYIQALTLSDEDIKGLIKPTIDWIQQVCSGDLLSAMLYSFGNKSTGIGFDLLYACAQTTYTKALVKDCNFLEDSYVKQKIYKNITETINHAKIGKIWVRGNYQFMIADPVAQCQSALGLKPIGVLKKNEVYSKFWKDRFTQENRSLNESVIDTCRSPMIDQHEHNPMSVSLNNPEADKWLEHLYSGIIYNIYDTSCFRHEDSDYDGDIVLSTDNEYFIKGSHKDHNIITYQKGVAKPDKMTIANITKTVMKGFGTGVGGFSNTATILYAMAAIFNKPGKEDQYNEIMLRIKLLREIVGQEIDRIKGADKPFLPKEWKIIEKILPTDTQDEIIEKIKRNSMVVKKKPYFFRYLYPELNQKYKQFESSYNQISRDMFGIKFKKLLRKETKTEEEKDLIRKYQKYSPLITAPCTMNKLCRAIEDVDFDIKFLKEEDGSKQPVVSKLPTFEDKYKDQFDQIKYDTVKLMYQKYCSRKQLGHLDSLIDVLSCGDQYDDYAEFHGTTYDESIKELQAELTNHGITGEEFLFYSNRLSKQYSRFNWAFTWNVLEDQIIKLIPLGKSFCPIRDDEGDYEYLGLRYSLKDLTLENEEEAQQVFDQLFFNGETEIPDEKLFENVLKHQQYLEKYQQTNSNKEDL
jgi:hypothetical protein